MSRESKNALAFLDSIVSAGGFQLRQPGYFTVNAMRTLDMKLGKGKDACAELSAAAMSEQVHAFLFIQAAPLESVSRGIRFYERLVSPRNDAAPLSPEDAWDEFTIKFVDPFLAQIPPEGIAAAYEQLGTLDEADAAVVDAAPPADQRRERPDPNSSSQGGSPAE
jgi:hypothetical protein